MPLACIELNVAKFSPHKFAFAHLTQFIECKRIKILKLCVNLFLVVVVNRFHELRAMML